MRTPLVKIISYVETLPTAIWLGGKNPITAANRLLVRPEMQVTHKPIFPPGMTKERFTFGVAIT